MPPRFLPVFPSAPCLAHQQDLLPILWQPHWTTRLDHCHKHLSPACKHSPGCVPTSFFPSSSPLSTQWERSSENMAHHCSADTPLGTAHCTKDALSTRLGSTCRLLTYRTLLKPSHIPGSGLAAFLSAAQTLSTAVQAGMCCYLCTDCCLPPTAERIHFTVNGIGING